LIYREKRGDALFRGIYRLAFRPLIYNEEVGMNNIYEILDA